MALTTVYLFLVTTMTPTAAQDPPKDPPADPKYPRRVTLRMYRDGTEVYAKANQKAFFRVNTNTGDSYWHVYKGGLPSRKPVKGDTVTEDDGPDSGTVWVIERVADLTDNYSCVVTRKPK